MPVAFETVSEHFVVPLLGGEKATDRMMSAMAVGRADQAHQMVDPWWLLYLARLAEHARQPQSCKAVCL